MIVLLKAKLKTSISSTVPIMSTSTKGNTVYIDCPDKFQLKYDSITIKASMYGLGCWFSLFWLTFKCSQIFGLIPLSKRRGPLCGVPNQKTRGFRN